MQFEQEFGLILGRSNAKHAFVTEWCTKYIPAIISYGESNIERAIREILENLNVAMHGNQGIVAKTMATDFYPTIISQCLIIYMIPGTYFVQMKFPSRKWL